MSDETNLPQADQNHNMAHQDQPLAQDQPMAHQDQPMVDEDQPQADRWDLFEIDGEPGLSTPDDKVLKTVDALASRLQKIPFQPVKHYTESKQSLVPLSGGDLKAACSIISCAVSGTKNVDDVKVRIQINGNRMELSVSWDGATTRAVIPLDKIPNIPVAGLALSMSSSDLMGVAKACASDRRITFKLTPVAEGWRTAVATRNYRRDLGVLLRWVGEAEVPRQPLATEQMDCPALTKAVRIVYACKPRPLHEEHYGVIEMGDKKLWGGDPQFAVLVSGDTLPTSNFALELAQARKLWAFGSLHNRGSLRFSETDTSLIFESAAGCCTFQKTARRYPERPPQIPAPDINVLDAARDQLQVSLPLFGIISPWKRYRRDNQLPIRLQYEAETPGVLTLSARQPLGTNTAERRITVGGSIASGDWDLNVRWADFFLASAFFTDRGVVAFDMPKPGALRLTQHDGDLCAEAYLALS